MQGSYDAAPRAAVGPDAHQRRVWRWPAKHLRGESKVAWSILYAQNGYRLGWYREHVTAAYIGNLYNAGDPRGAGETVLKNLLRVRLVRSRTLGKTMEIELVDTAEAFRVWQQELGVVIADPQAELPFPEPPAEPLALAEEESPTVAITPPRRVEADQVGHDRLRTQGSKLLAGFDPRDIPHAGYPGDIPGISPPRARASSSSSKKEFNSLITHQAQRSSDEDVRATERASRDIPGKSPRGLAAIGDVAGGAIARLLDDEHWEQQQLRRREAVAKLIREWVGDEGFFESDVLMYACLIMEGRLKLDVVDLEVRRLNGFADRPRSRGAVFNTLMEKHCKKLGIVLALERKRLK